METTISEIRSIVQRRRELEIEDQRLYQRFLELLELNQGLENLPAIGYPQNQEGAFCWLEERFSQRSKRGDGRFVVKFKR